MPSSADMRGNFLGNEVFFFAGGCIVQARTVETLACITVQIKSKNDLAFSRRPRRPRRFIRAQIVRLDPFSPVQVPPECPRGRFPVIREEPLFMGNQPTVTGTRDVVSFPKISMTLTATTYRPGPSYVCGALFRSRFRSLRVRKLCH